MIDDPLSPSEFAAFFNQTLDAAWPIAVIEGELSDFRISKNRWLYFDLKDSEASIKFFGTVYNLPGPLEDGLKLRVVGMPRLHPRFGFSVNVQSISAVGEGSIKKAEQMLRAKLEAEGLFDAERKRPIPSKPQYVGLVTASASAAYSDFIKIINQRWAGLQVILKDSLVQGQNAPAELAAAIEAFSNLSKPPEVLVIIRGGGSLDDLAAFNDERVVRAVASSRVPTLVAVGHETDVSLAELAADLRASTPSNAAELLVPDKKHQLEVLSGIRRNLTRRLLASHSDLSDQLVRSSALAGSSLFSVLAHKKSRLDSAKRLSALFDPRAAMKRGYAILNLNGKALRSIVSVMPGDSLNAQISDGTIEATVKSAEPYAQ